MVSGLMMAALGMQGVTAGEVARAQFTTGVTDREPVDAVTGVDADTRSVFFFTELRDLQGRHVVHRWEYDGEPMAVVGFDVGGPRWRVWSSKQMQPDWQGLWRVQVVTDDGEVLADEVLAFGDVDAPAVDDAEEIIVPETHFMRSGS
ncbi:DUF2914 domain-containing protein [Thioalkalivibrio denitrificans]|nr:DUF2914 domain-containing protein [Thioalkalivibrio denitrificans]